jgi:hypothetical protein
VGFFERMKTSFSPKWSQWLFTFGGSLALAAGAVAAEPFAIEVVDEATGRGVPMVELQSVDGQTWVTDSAGLVAFEEPGIVGRPVFFSVKSHGYEYPKDGFGIAGVRLTPEPGGKATVKIKRLNIAERLYRQTGRGIYRDTILLGRKSPIVDGLGAGQVAGQDSAQVAMYRGKLFWIWGDTSRMEYPMGNFRSSGAWSELPAKGGLAPSVGVNFQYFTDTSGFSRPMVSLSNPEGVVWIDGLTVVRDDLGAEKLVARYQRRRGLEKLLEQGICIFNDEKQIFESATTLPLEEEWRALHGQVTAGRDDGFLYMGSAGLSVRVPARLRDVLDPAKYEAWTCAGKDGPSRRADGTLDFAWRKDARPIESTKEAEWLKVGKIRAEECRMLPIDVKSGERVTLHVGTVRWNAHRQRWVMIAGQYSGKASMLGEVWYAEAKAPTGPWKRAVQIMTHEKMSFYNPVQHPFFDEGASIYFEGTYTKDFSGSEQVTPRYNYNQMMYRLNLDDPRLAEARE